MSVSEKKAHWKETPVFCNEEIKKIHPKRIPKHVAFIPDGNRRWAKKNRVLPEEGHRLGADSLLNIIKAGHQMGVERLTFYIFSTENWQRPKREIKAQMELLEKSIILQKPRMIENGVRFLSIGDLSKFPPHLIKLIEETKRDTAHCDKIDVVFAMNYGGRDDLRRAFKKMLEDYDRDIFSKEDVSEQLIGQYLDTAEWNDPELLIRTSGELRISNFLLWQLSYAEFLSSPVYWPEFTPHHFYQSILDFQQRERRLGGS